MVFVISSNLSAKVDLPWSMWAMIQKFLILYGGKYSVLLAVENCGLSQLVFLSNNFILSIIFLLILNLVL